MKGRGGRRGEKGETAAPYYARQLWYNLLPHILKKMSKEFKQTKRTVIFSLCFDNNFSDVGDCFGNLLF